MSQRDSGYARIERDLYETPEWVTEALLPHLPPGMRIWEPAAGRGKMVKVLVSAGYNVNFTDITDGFDFLNYAPEVPPEAIVTNPPYAIADAFVDRALAFPDVSYVAFLLRTDFDHAICRRPFFANNPWFAKKLVLTKRIRWFAESRGNPSFNHAWFIWKQGHKGPPTLAYGP